MSGLHLKNIFSGFAYFDPSTREAYRRNFYLRFCFNEPEKAFEDSMSSVAWSKQWVYKVEAFQDSFFKNSTGWKFQQSNDLNGTPGISQNVEIPEGRQDHCKNCNKASDGWVRQIHSMLKKINTMNRNECCVSESMWTSNFPNLFSETHSFFALFLSLSLRNC